MTRAGKLVAALLLSFFAGAACPASAQAPQKTPKVRSQGAEQKPDPLALLLRQAEDAIDKKDYAAALQPLQTYLAQRPDDAVAHFQLGYAYSGLEHEEEAKGEYAKAIALNPKLAAAHLNLGLTLLDRDPAGAVEPFRRAAELLPDQSRPRYLLGVALERSGKFSEAVEQYELARGLGPKDYEIRFALGRTLLRADRAAEAEIQFREALALRADSAPARLGLSQSLLAQKKPEGAVEELRTYLRQQPQDQESRQQLVSLLISLKRYDRALGELDRGDAMQPSVASYRLRAQIYVEQNLWPQAAEVLQKALQLAPQDAELHARLGRVWLGKRDFAAAERELRQALQMDPMQTDALRDLLAVYYLGEKYQAALEVLDLLDRRLPPNAGSWFVRATCYDRLERKAEALAAYEKFLELDQGRNDKQDFQARQRIHLLKQELEQRKR
jgi:Flp pilus assembly protein TadD